jgi:hypothetical protein
MLIFFWALFDVKRPKTWFYLAVEASFRVIICYFWAFYPIDAKKASILGYMLFRCQNDIFARNMSKMYQICIFLIKNFAKIQIIFQFFHENFRKIQFFFFKFSKNKKFNVGTLLWELVGTLFKKCGNFIL